MCGRYTTPEESEAERYFEVHRLNWRFEPSYNVAPSQAVPAVRQIDGVREGVLMRWGLVPFFAKGVAPKYSTINARIETLDSAASYRGPWRRAQRCVLPATGFYEWQLREDGGKQPYFIHLADQAIFGFAALWDASRRDDGLVVESCTIVTMPANELMARIHNAPGKQRMPAILAAADLEAWLGGAADQARAVLQPYPAALMVAWPVAARVNSPRNNGPDLITALD